MTMNNQAQHFRQNDRLRCSGQALVEFAMIVPILAFVFFAIIQYGLIFNAYMTLRYGAHITARTLALTGASTNNPTAIAQTAIQPSLDTTHLTAVSLTSVQLVAPNDAYKVILSYSIPLYISFVVPGATGNTLPITAQAVYRRL